MALEIYTDGGARGNPGPAGAGIILRDDQGRSILEAGYYLGRMTNNVAEYTALVMALEAAARWGADEVSIFSDSELMVRQLTGEYRVKDAKLGELFEKAQRLLLKFDQWRIKHIRREENRKADDLVNKALNRREDVVQVQLGDAQPDDRPPAEDRSAAPKPKASRPAEPPRADASGLASVAVRVVRAGKPGVCRAGLEEGQEFVFGATVPPGLCVFAAKALIDTVLALRHAAADDDPPAPVLVRCGLPSCGGQFEVRLSPADPEDERG